MSGLKSRKLSSEFLAQVKRAHDILQIIGEHVVLRKAGREYVGLCPFHSERSGSFYVNSDKQLYHCHGCHASGDLFKFVQEIHGVGFFEAVRELAERARISLPKEWGSDGAGLTPEQQKARDQKLEKIALSAKLNRFVAEFYFQNLKKSALAGE
jgi:DNA primase